MPWALVTETGLDYSALLLDLAHESRQRGYRRHGIFFRHGHIGAVRCFI